LPEISKWDVDQENPVPAGDGDDPAAQQRSDHRGEERRPGEVGDRVDHLGFRRHPQHREPADRHHHRAAEALQDSRHNQHPELGTERTEGRGEGEDRDRGEQDATGTEPVGEPAADRQADRHRDQIAGHRGVDVHRGDPEIVGDRRCRRRDDRSVEVLHEERPGDEQGKGPVHAATLVVPGGATSGGQADLRD